MKKSFICSGPDLACFCYSGAKRSSYAAELVYARQKVVTIAKAFRLQAIDMVHIDYKGEILLLTDRLIQVLRDRQMLQSWCMLDRRLSQ